VSFAYLGFPCDPFVCFLLRVSSGLPAAPHVAQDRLSRHIKRPQLPNPSFVPTLRLVTPILARAAKMGGRPWLSMVQVVQARTESPSVFFICISA
jgi:hypothetical protein